MRMPRNKKLKLRKNFRNSLKFTSEFKKAYFALNVKQLDKHYHSKIQFCLSVYFNFENY